MNLYEIVPAIVFKGTLLQKQTNKTTKWVHKKHVLKTNLPSPGTTESTCSKAQSNHANPHPGKGPVLRRPRRASGCGWPCGRKGRRPGPAATPARGCCPRRPWQPWSAATCPPGLWQSDHPPSPWWTPSSPPARAPCSSCPGSCGSAPPPPGHTQWWLWGQAGAVRTLSSACWHSLHSSYSVCPQGILEWLSLEGS